MWGGKLEGEDAEAEREMGAGEKENVTALWLFFLAMNCNPEVGEAHHARTSQSLINGLCKKAVTGMVLSSIIPHGMMIPCPQRVPHLHTHKKKNSKRSQL